MCEYFMEEVSILPLLRERKKGRFKETEYFPQSLSEDEQQEYSLAFLVVCPNNARWS